MKKAASSHEKELKMAKEAASKDAAGPSASAESDKNLYKSLEEELKKVKIELDQVKKAKQSENESAKKQLQEANSKIRSQQEEIKAAKTSMVLKVPANRVNRVVPVRNSVPASKPATISRPASSTTLIRRSQPMSNLRTPVNASIRENPFRPVTAKKPTVPVVSTDLSTPSRRDPSKRKPAVPKQMCSPKKKTADEKLESLNASQEQEVKAPE